VTASSANKIKDLAPMNVEKYGFDSRKNEGSSKRPCNLLGLKGIYPPLSESAAFSERIKTGKFLSLLTSYLWESQNQPRFLSGLRPTDSEDAA